MARECGRGREGTIGRLSVPATRTAGPEGCKTTGLRGGRDTETETERNTNKARPSRVPAAAAAAVHRGYNLPSSLRPSPECVSSPTTVLGCLRPPVSRLQAAPPRPAPSFSHDLTLACPLVTAAAQPGKSEAESRRRPWVPPHPTSERGAGSWPWC